MTANMAAAPWVNMDKNETQFPLLNSLSATESSVQNYTSMESTQLDLHIVLPFGLMIHALGNIFSA